VKSRNLCFFKGNVVPEEDAVVNIMSPTAQFGLNVFEGVRGYWNPELESLYIFRLDDHIDRLFESCKIIGINCPYSESDILDSLAELLRQSNFSSDIAFRIIIFVDGKGSWSSLNVGDMCISPIEKPRRTVDGLEGFSACISTWERISDRSMPPRVKAGANYVSGRYSQLEAQRSGYDVPLLLNSRGTISEAPGACLFMVRGERLITPSFNCSILESITRATLIEIASIDGIVVEEREIDRTELYIADEVFLCGSSAEIMPLISIDRIPIGSGKPGEITTQLLRQYNEIVSNELNDDMFSHWRRVIK
jgi:branched-chain amino acid aminotransferase